MANLVQNPYEIITNADGDPLEDGYVFVGEPGLSPVTNPLQAYWDSDLTVPAVNIRTKGGYFSRSGTPGRLYTATNYSILVQDRNQRTIYTQLDSVDYANSASGDLISSVETIADLRLIATAEPYDQVSVGGSVTVGDGLMGPLYYWDPNSAGVDNGVSIIEPTATTGNGRWLWINTLAPKDVVNIDSSVTLNLDFKNRIFLVDTASALVLAVPDGDFQGQDINIANRGVDTLEITGTGIAASTFVADSAQLTWLGTQWSIIFTGSLTITGNVTIAGDLTIEDDLIVEGTVQWKHYFRDTSVLPSTVFTELATWIPNNGDSLAVHGQYSTAGLEPSIIAAILRTSPTIIELLRIRLGQTLWTELVLQDGQATPIWDVCEIMSNFDAIT